MKPAGGNLASFLIILTLCLPFFLHTCSTQELELNVCSDTSPTNHSTCLTLGELLPNVSSNTTLLLEPGVHTIQSFFQVVNKANLSLIGDPANSSSVVIKCGDKYGLIFMSIESLSFSGLTIRNCSFKGFENVNDTFTFVRNYITLYYEPLSDFSTGVFMADVSNFRVQNVVFDRNEGFGLVGINIIGDSEFTNVNFTGNSPNECVLDILDAARPGGTGGAMFLLYQDYINLTNSGMPSNLTTLLIENAHVENNSNCRLDLFNEQHNLLSRSLEPRLIQNNSFIGAGGITIALAQSAYTVYANITNSLFKRNSGFYHGSALEVAHFEVTSDSHVFITDTYFDSNGIMEGVSNILNSGGALIIDFYLPVPESQFNTEVLSKIIMQVESSVEVINCTFRKNIATSGSGIQVFSLGPTVSGIQDRLMVKDCLFEKNQGEHGSAIFITEISYSAFEPGLKVIIDSIEAVNNSKPVTATSSFQADSTGVLDINFIRLTLSGMNQFDSNGDTAISVYSGILVVTGSTNITNNVGVNGGGLSLDTESYLVLSGDRAEMLFRENRALVHGGGIYVNFNTIRTNNYDCFLFFDEVDIFCHIFDTCSEPRGRFSLSFVNNMALFGRAIFGSSFSRCPWTNQDGKGYVYLTLHDSISDANDSVLPIFFDPPFDENSEGKRINTAAHSIIANIGTDESGTPHLNEENTVHAFPGQEIQVPLGTLDGLNQSVPLTIFSQLETDQGSEAHSQIGESNRFLIAGGAENFTDVPFLVFADQNNSFNMTITSEEALATLQITVVLNECPVGFRFDKVKHACVCDIETLEQVTCNTDNGTITHREDFWVGRDDDFNYIQHKCVLDYCERGRTVLNLSEPDTQCRDNRAGVLCGGCRDRNSRMIGTFACGVCDSYWYLFLILAFAALGILLFAYMALFNVTIADGFLNGFIFYSNIIGVYLAFYIPVQSGSARDVPNVVISFLNLNFGIQTCFYPNMTELELTLLSFVFPLYLLMILLVVTLCGRCISNQMVAKFFQKINVTRVFATLILLSYTSFINTSFAVLTSITIEGTVNQTRWRVDPNVVYSDPLHIFLVVFSVALLIVFVPIPLLLLFPRLIFRTPVLRKLKPLVDAFIAPFAPKREFWIGLRMIFRLVFFLLSLVLPSNNVLIVLSILLVIFTVIEGRFQPFNSRIKNLLSRVLLTNMTIFSVTAISVHLLPEDMATNFNVFNLYVFLFLFFLVNVHYLLIRFKCTRDPYEKCITYFQEKINQFVLKISYSKLEKKMGKKKKVHAVLNVTHTSVDFSEPPTVENENNNFEETEFIAFREEILATENTNKSARSVPTARPALVEVLH